MVQSCLITTIYSSRKIPVGLFLTFWNWNLEAVLSAVFRNKHFLNDLDDLKSAH